MGFGTKAADITAIKERTDRLPDSPANNVLVQSIDTDVTAVKAKTDNLPSDPADESLLEAEIEQNVSPMDFWSDGDDVIDLPVVAADIDLPNIVVSGLPSGVTLLRVVAILKVRAIENTSASGANAINGAQAIRVKKSTGTWGVDDIAAIDLPDNLWTVAASTRESGDVLVGDNDLKNEVDGDGTYNLRFENALVDYASLRLNDILVGLKFYFRAT